MARVAWANRRLVALMGPPGSGKSTWAKRQGVPVASTDAIRSAHGTGDFTTSLMGDVYERAYERVAAVLRSNGTVIFDAPLTNPVVRKRLLKIADAYHARADLFYFATPLETCLARQAGREVPVPDQVVRRMHDEIAAQAQIARHEGWNSVTVKV